MEKIVPTVKKTKDAVAEAGATLGGFLAGNFAMALFEKFLPVQFGKFSPALGAAGVLPHYMGLSDPWRAFGNGVMAAGGTQALKNVTAGQTGFVATLNAALPGRGTFQGIGHYGGNGGSAMPLRGLGASKVDEMLLSGPSPSGQKLLTDELLSA